MNPTLVNPYDSSLPARRERLLIAQTVLKQEFAGIDEVIDQVIDSLTPWYLFPALQDRPTIINLWGLTGVGKSSLVARIASLLEFEKQYFRFDLGEAYDREHSIKKKLMTLFPDSSGIPMMLAFDEFQHARTIDANGKELDKGFIRIVWEIMDSGKFTMNYVSPLQNDLPQFISVFTFALNNGVVVKNGEVTEGAEFFQALKSQRGIRYNLYSTVHGAGKPAEEKIFFFDTYLIDQLFQIARHRFSSEIELRDYLDTLDGFQTVQLLRELYESSLAHQYVDCTKAVVFVMGNLDEAYPMSGNLNPDISADEFYRQSLKINLSSIKIALRRRFRSEQIARLGNNHIIYPALNENAFRRIIRQELEKLRTRADSVGIELHFDESVYALIYQEGVFPTQGARPLFTTIHQLVGTRLGKIMCEKIMMLGQASAMVNLKYAETKMIIEFLHEEKVIRTTSQIIDLSLGKLRQPTHDDFQAIIAVHESGHAILSMVLLRILPKAVCSVSADEGNAGFVYNSIDRKYIARHEIPARLAVILGGMAAEEVVFGKKRVTTGARSDLQQATHLVNQLIMESGLGDHIGYFQYAPQATTEQLVADTRHVEQAEQLISQAYELAMNTLQEQKKWLINLADFLADQTQANPSVLLKIAGDHAKGIEVAGLQLDTSNLFYRSHLKGLLKEVNEPASSLSIIHMADQDLKNTAA